MNNRKITSLNKKLESWGGRKYQKAVKLKKVWVRGSHRSNRPYCKNTLWNAENKPIQSPRWPRKFFILHSSSKQNQILNALEKDYWTILVLNLGLKIVDGVTRLDLEGDSLPSYCQIWGMEINQAEKDETCERTTLIVIDFWKVYKAVYIHWASVITYNE